ncbi:hypothetical protein EJB05_33701, partial [Eragrostis curvula]
MGVPAAPISGSGSGHGTGVATRLRRQYPGLYLAVGLPTRAAPLAVQAAPEPLPPLAFQLDFSGLALFGGFGLALEAEPLLVAAAQQLGLGPAHARGLAVRPAGRGELLLLLSSRAAAAPRVVPPRRFLLAVAAASCCCCSSPSLRAAAAPRRRCELLLLLSSRAAAASLLASCCCSSRRSSSSLPPRRRGGELLLLLLAVAAPSALRSFASAPAGPRLGPSTPTRTAVDARDSATPLEVAEVTPSASIAGTVEEADNCCFVKHPVPVIKLAAAAASSRF